MRDHEKEDLPPTNKSATPCAGPEAGKTARAEICRELGVSQQTFLPLAALGPEAWAWP